MIRIDEDHVSLTNRELHTIITTLADTTLYASIEAEERHDLADSPQAHKEADDITRIIRKAERIGARLIRLFRSVRKENHA
jgi:pyoverdine/dityrosine biosynthesis protein Dit1